MSDEITVTCGVRLANGDLDDANIGPYSYTIDQNTAKPVRVGGSQIVGFAAHEAIDIAGLTTLGVAYLRNRDPAGGNFFEVGVDVGGTFYPLLRFNPGERFPLRFAQGITPYMQADTADVIVQREIFDD